MHDGSAESFHARLNIIDLPVVIGIGIGARRRELNHQGCRQHRHADGDEPGMTVLVVDDEDDLREVIRRILQRRGFTALVASDTDQAVAVCRDHPGDIHVLLTDLSMPGLSGQELARSATDLRPGLRVVYVSGTSRDLAVGHYKPINSDRFLNDCHEFIFHFTPNGDTILDRLALAVERLVLKFRASVLGRRHRDHVHS